MNLQKHNYNKTKVCAHLCDIQYNSTKSAVFYSPFTNSTTGMIFVSIFSCLSTNNSGIVDKNYVCCNGHVCFHKSMPATTFSLDKKVFCHWFRHFVRPFYWLNTLWWCEITLSLPYTTIMRLTMVVPLRLWNDDFPVRNTYDHVRFCHSYNRNQHTSSQNMENALQTIFSNSFPRWK